MIIAESFANMREQPSEKEDVVSQALFGEKVTVLQQEKGSSKITTLDGYSGWVDSCSLISLSYSPSLFTCRKAVPVYAEKNIRSGPVMILPFGVGLEADASDAEWIEVVLPSGKNGFIQKGNLSEEQKLSKSDLADFALEFLGLPYIWGGRSSFGYDCSGFVQMLYKQMGITLPRDATLQINDPRLSELEEPTSGDLIFWGASREKIGHVGLYIDEGKFIHATSREQRPWLRISHLTDYQWDPKTSSIYPYRVCGRI